MSPLENDVSTERFAFDAFLFACQNTQQLHGHRFLEMQGVRTRTFSPSDRWERYFAIAFSTSLRVSSEAAIFWAALAAPDSQIDSTDLLRTRFRTPKIWQRIAREQAEDEPEIFRVGGALGRLKHPAINCWATHVYGFETLSVRSPSRTARENAAALQTLGLSGPKTPIGALAPRESSSVGGDAPDIPQALISGSTTLDRGALAKATHRLALPAAHFPLGTKTLGVHLGSDQCLLVDLKHSPGSAARSFHRLKCETKCRIVISRRGRPRLGLLTRAVADRVAGDGVPLLIAVVADDSCCEVLAAGSRVDSARRWSVACRWPRLVDQ